MLALAASVKKSIRDISVLWERGFESHLNNLPSDIFYAMILDCQDQWPKWMKYRIERYLPTIRSRRDTIEQLRSKLPGNLWKTKPLKKSREIRLAIARKQLIGDDVVQQCHINVYDDSWLLIARDHNSVIQAIKKANTSVREAIQYANLPIEDAHSTKKEYDTYKHALTQLLSASRLISSKCDSFVSNEALAATMMEAAYTAAVYRLHAIEVFNRIKLNPRYNKLESLINCDNKDEIELNEILKEFGMVSDGYRLDENGEFFQKSIAIDLESDIKSIVKGMKIIIPMLKKTPISLELRDSDRPYKLNNKLLSLGNTISSFGDHYIIIHPDNDNLAKHIYLGFVKVEKFNWIWRPINKVVKRSVKIVKKDK